MTNQSKTLLFFGNERILAGVEFDEAPVLSSLISAGYNIAAVILKDNPTKSRKIKKDIVSEIASANGIPIAISPSDEEISKLVDLHKPSAAVLVAYGKIISQNVIDLFPRGIINIHPSLLPKYRGSSPIETAIANGDEKIGVSLMLLTASMDSGPILAQDSIKNSYEMSKYEIGISALRLGASMLVKNIPQILSGAISPIIQDESEATFTSRISKDMSLVKPNEMSSFEAYNKMKSLQIFPKTKIVFNNTEIIATKFHVSDAKEDISYLCSDGKFIVIDELTAPSGKNMSSSDFLRGYAKN